MEKDTLGSFVTQALRNLHFLDIFFEIERDL